MIEKRVSDEQAQSVLNQLRTAVQDRRSGVFQHPEAYCLMQYQADDGSETEVIWNSRDGVTPFSVTLRSGKPATHIRWSEDVRVSRLMADALGVRRFADHTEETARRAAVEYVDRLWDHPTYPMSRAFLTKEHAVTQFTADFVGGPAVFELGEDPNR